MIRRFLALILILSFFLPAASLAASADSTMTSMDCYKQGEAEADEEVGVGGQVMGGFLMGALLGPIGPLLMSGTQDKPDPPVQNLLAIKDENCRLAYMLGYQEKGHSKRKSAATGGAIMGTAAMLLVALHFYYQNSE